MSYQSIHFLLFVPAVLMLYYIAGAKRQKYVLLLANIYFFVTSGVHNIPVILVSLICSFFGGRKIDRIYTIADEQLTVAQTAAEKKQIRVDAKTRAKKHLILALVIVLGLLVVYKSAVIIIGSINKKTDADPIQMLIPLGISYYTFMAVSYMLDIYWRKSKAAQSFVTYAVFLSWFPHIVQGPIDRYKDVGPQIDAGAKLSYRNVTFGAQLAMWGFFKKMVIADRLNVFVSKVFENYQDYSGSILLVAAIFSAFELYCNFSGCMDIVRGIAEMFGITIAKNFDHPFVSKSAAEFWRRWHITLGSWFKDYVYMPITISPKMSRIMQAVKKRFGIRAAKAIAVIIPTAIVWLLTGIWHGTGWNYVIWGIYWGIIIILSSVFQPEFAKLTKALRINTEAPSWQFFQILRTFCLFVVSRILSSCNTVKDSFQYIGQILTKFNAGTLFDQSIHNIGWDRPNFHLALVLLLMLWIIERLETKGSIRERVASYNIVFRWILYYGLLFAILIFGMYGPGYVASDFVYGNY